jgi:SnoaL-like domain
MSPLAYCNESRGGEGRSATRRRRAGAAGLLTWSAVALLLGGCGSDQASPAQVAELQREADTYAIDQIEVNWHKATATKDVNLIVSLFAASGSVVAGTQTFTGRSALRSFFLKDAPPFFPGNDWEADTPAYKIRISIFGDTGTLYFECHFVDVTTHMVKLVVALNDTVARINGHWLITKAFTTPATLSP